MTTWRKSSYSGVDQSACVEVANLTERIGLRDSKNPEGPKLTVDRTAFLGLVQRVQAGALDL